LTLPKRASIRAPVRAPLRRQRRLKADIAAVRLRCNKAEPREIADDLLAFRPYRFAVSEQQQTFSL